MIDTILTLLYGTFVLIFGILLTAAFAGIRPTKKNFLTFLGFFTVCGILQLVVIFAFSESAVWKLYPFITHLPLILLLCLVYRKPLATALAATFTAYLCCQPPNWFSILVTQLTNHAVIGTSAHILCLILVGYVAVCYLSPYLSEIFNKDRRSVCIFAFVPTVYYLFDYLTSVYTNLLFRNEQVIIEFLAFFLAIVYMSFCLIYYKEHEQKTDAQRKEQIIRIMVEQQTKEIIAVKKIEKELRLLRHDMRLILSSLAISIENSETDTALEIINAHISRIDETKLVRFCSNDIVNYVISDYAARCKAEHVSFCHTIELEELHADEIMFSSILSNALDNALNAQRSLPPSRRNIQLMLKQFGSKLLLSVKNPIDQQVVFSDGLPVSQEDRHGYGTQSIRYLTEHLGGNCQFSVQGNTFILRVIL